MVPCERARPEGSESEMQNVADAADISVLFFSAGANFWTILGHFLVLIFCGKILLCAI